MKPASFGLLIALATTGCATKPAFRDYDASTKGIYPGEVWQKAVSPEHIGWSSQKLAAVGDLIRSRSGIYRPALGESSAMAAQRPKRHSHPPGSFWYYNNWNFNALGTIFERETGTNLFVALQRQIAEPLEMEDFKLAYCCQYRTSEEYRRSPRSLHEYYLIRMSTRDLARFGLLFLRHGRWRDQQIVSADWVRESTASHSTIGPDSGYGYMWWTGVEAGFFSNVRARAHSYYAAGYGGHQVFVLPYRKLVVVHRVNTDRRGPYPRETQIGRLLWMILDAAGETDIGPEPSMAAVQGVRVTENNVAEVLGVETVTIRGTTRPSLVERSEWPLKIIIAPDGTLTIATAVGKPAEFRWWLEEDRFCLRPKRSRRGKFCTHLVRDGSRMMIFLPDGTLEAQGDIPQLHVSLPLARAH